MSYERHTPHRRSLPLLSIGVDALWSPRASSAKRLTPSRALHLVQRRCVANVGQHTGGSIAVAHLARLRCACALRSRGRSKQCSTAYFITRETGPATAK